MWSTPKSWRYDSPIGSSIMQNHMLRLATSDGSTSASGMWVQYLWRSHCRSARSSAAVIHPMPPSDHTSLMSGNWRGIGLTIMFTDERGGMRERRSDLDHRHHALERHLRAIAPPMCMQIGRPACSHSAKSGYQ